MRENIWLGNIQNLIQVSLFILLSISCLFACLNYFNDPRIVSKWVFCYFITLLLGVFSLVFFTRKEKIPISQIDILLFLFWLLYLCSASLRGSPSLEFYSKTMNLFLLYLVLRVISSEDSLRTLPPVIIFVILGLSFYGIAQAMGILPAGTRFRVYGNFDNPAGYASALALGFPFILHTFFYANKKLKKIALFAMVITLIAVVLSESRAGILSIGGVSIFYFFFCCKKKLPQKRKWAYLIVTIIVILVLIGLYLIKEDSANGRLLIWKCSWEMIKDKPLFGFGMNGFDAHYMLYQASYFEQNPDSSFLMLADNVKHPFNEFLLLLIRYGIAGGMFVAIFAIVIIRCLYKRRHPQAVVYGASLISLFIFSCFSYPMEYPFSWFILLWAIAGIQNLSMKNNHLSFCLVHSKIIKLFIAIVLLLGIVVTGFYSYTEWQWYHIAHKSLKGQTQQMIPEYEKLFPYMENNILFLYNYAAELNHIKRYEDSEQILELCRKSLNDYDVQILSADNLIKMKKYEIAERKLWKASNMCPVRFAPLYHLSTIYQETGKENKLKEIAIIIVDKPIKIHSSVVLSIKKEMKLLLGEIDGG